MIFVISLFKQDSEIFLTILWKTSLKILHFKLKTLRLYSLFCFLGIRTHSFIACSFFIPFILSWIAIQMFCSFNILCFWIKIQLKCPHWTVPLKCSFPTANYVLYYRKKYQSFTGFFSLHFITFLFVKSMPNFVKTLVNITIIY